jgi:hypothetical protein
VHDDDGGFGYLSEPSEHDLARILAELLPVERCCTKGFSASLNLGPKRSSAKLRAGLSPFTWPRLGFTALGDGMRRQSRNFFAVGATVDPPSLARARHADDRRPMLARRLRRPRT